jgi:hypothetical protein
MVKERCWWWRRESAISSFIIWRLLRLDTNKIIIDSKITALPKKCYIRPRTYSIVTAITLHTPFRTLPTAIIKDNTPVPREIPESSYRVSATPSIILMPKFETTPDLSLAEVKISGLDLILHIIISLTLSFTQPDHLRASMVAINDIACMHEGFIRYWRCHEYIFVDVLFLFL